MGELGQNPGQQADGRRGTHPTRLGENGNNAVIHPRTFAMASAVILPGSTVTVSDASSIYKGYKGIVQRLSGERAAVLFEGGCWDKLVTFRLQSLALC